MQVKHLSLGALVVLLALVGCNSSNDPTEKPDSGVPTDGGGSDGGGSDGGGSDGGGSDGGGDPTPVTGDQALDAIASAFCDYGTRCGLIPFGDKEMCVEWVTTGDLGGENSPAAIRATIDASKASTDSEKLAACADALRTRSCDADSEIDFRDIPACDSAFTGTVADGESCISDLACASGSRCFNIEQSENQSECGATCNKLGEHCRRDEDCGSDKFCVAMTCTTPEEAPAGDGEDCSENFLCQKGLSCIPRDDQGAMTCSGPSAAGGPCSEDAHCAAGLDCDHSSWPGVCQERPERAGEGEPCNPEPSDRPECAAGLVCVPSADFQSASCEKSKGLGDSCTKPLECGGVLSLFICDAATQKCVERPKSGACPVPEIAFGCSLFDAYCDVTDPEEPTCKLFKAAGATCSEDSECGGMFSSAYCEYDENETGVCMNGSGPVCEP